MLQLPQLWQQLELLSDCHELVWGHRLQARPEQSERVEARGSGEDKVSVEPTGWKLS